MIGLSAHALAFLVLILASPVKSETICRNTIIGGEAVTQCMSREAFDRQKQEAIKQKSQEVLALDRRYIAASKQQGIPSNCNSLGEIAAKNHASRFGTPKSAYGLLKSVEIEQSSCKLQVIRGLSYIPFNSSKGWIYDRTTNYCYYIKPDGGKYYASPGQSSADQVFMDQCNQYLIGNRVKWPFMP